MRVCTFFQLLISIISFSIFLHNNVCFLFFFNIDLQNNVVCTCLQVGAFKKISMQIKTYLCVIRKLPVLKNQRYRDGSGPELRNRYP